MIKSAVSTRRSFLATSAAAGAFGLVVLAAAGCAQTVPAADADASAAKLRAAAEDKAVRPFRINVPEEALIDLRRRVVATRWPAKETVTDQSQGVQLAKVQALVRYWGTGYDWRKVEAKLNALPQFVTEIDGLDIHFIHVRSRHPNPMPMIMTHGWPGSPLELVKVIDPLTNPTAHGGRAEDAFHLVLPHVSRVWLLGQAASDWLGSRPRRAGLARVDAASGIQAIRVAGR